MLGRTDRRWRSVAILLLMCAFAFLAVLRLAYWQVAMASDLQEKAQPQLTGTTSEPPVRGRILDRNGVPLATTGYRDTLVGYPNTITTTQRVATVAALAAILDLNGTARAAVDSMLSSHDPSATLRRGLNADQSKAIRAGITGGQLHGLELLPQLVRIYPQEGGQPGTTLASQLLGFVSSDATGSHGIYGIEQEYDQILAGSSGNMAAAIGSGSGSGLTDSSAQVGGPGGDGRDITISIDATLQLQLEKELYLARVADKATRVSGLIMDPRTGEILAWASVPGYDANDGGNVAARDPQLVQDPIVSMPYEPGSVMKMLTATSALENHVVTPNSRIVDSVALNFGPNLSVHNWDGAAMGKIPFRDVIAFSRNVAVSRVAARLGRTTTRAATTLYKTWQKLGIGTRTGVDVRGEVAGGAADPRRKLWAPIDLANRAFGQSVMATPVQLATAFTPMINGGMHVQPHFLLAIGGRTQATTPGTRVLPRKVANQLLGILGHVTSSVPWYAKGSLIPGYQVGGKTGTAQIWNPSLGKYDRRYFNFTFVGYVGGDAPAAVVTVHIDHTRSLPNDQSEIKLNITSYQLFRRVARAVIRTQDVPRSSDQGAGQPEPGSQAEKVMEPLRYYRRTHPAGHGR